MKLKVYYSTYDKQHCVPYINEKGDWIDLRADKDYFFHAPLTGTEVIQ
jgi:hypothetical protein